MIVVPAGWPGIVPCNASPMTGAMSIGVWATSLTDQKIFADDTPAAPGLAGLQSMMSAPTVWAEVESVLCGMSVSVTSGGVFEDTVIENHQLNIPTSSES